MRAVIAFNDAKIRSFSKLEKAASSNHPGRIVGKNLSMKFPTKTGVNVVLDDLDIEINAGEFVALLGPSGCGMVVSLSRIAWASR